MLDHISLRTTDMARAKAFYDRVLGVLHAKPVMTAPGPVPGQFVGVGYGEDQKPWFWIGQSDVTGGPIHVAFAAANRAQVDAFHAAALAAGGTDNGAPGLRAHYHPNYYGAFVLDPDGNNIEAVCHRPA